MPFRLHPFLDTGLDEALLRILIDEHATRTLPRFARFWNYYRNPVASAATPSGARRVRLAQEAGLPRRLTGPRETFADDRTPPPEIVIENDIAWRIQAMVDFMFGKPLSFRSSAPDHPRRELIERVLAAVWEASGGIALLQDVALLGHIYGHVDIRLRVEDRAQGAPHTPPASRPGSSATPGSAGAVPPDDHIVRRAKDLLRIEIIEPTRGIPLLNPSDYRAIDAYIIRFERQLSAVSRAAPPWAAPWNRGHQQRARSTYTEILSGSHRQVYEDSQLILEEPLPWTRGRLPVVHIQNIAEPFRYEGLGEVEPLIPLQDELNTRLSDRASRVTLQSFKMYLLKGLAPEGNLRACPGAIWSTENPGASVQAFGGDADSPGEEAHIQEIREALDKQSGVPPLASGVVRARVGNLTSANALRITLMGILSKTARKRVTYGGGILRMCELILGALDHAGILRTSAQERTLGIRWPDPLPEDPHAQALAARTKAELGVARERILETLGESDRDRGVV
jgi:hypothetical protein